MKSGMRVFVFVMLFFITPNLVRADFTPNVQPRSYILMDYDTGEILAECNSEKSYPIASVTKVMTMLICMEALKSGKISETEMVTASEYACSMGGSQIYLEPGEQMSVDDLLKSVAVGSANDASVALAEHIMGSETAFIDAMNERAKTLGMKNTNFVNCNGLDEENHFSSAKDVAIMSRELLKHSGIRPYLGIWMDSIRDGKFGLTNTNKLIRFYNGAIGVKTGSTSEAKYCLSAAATRNGMTLVGVVLGAETSNDRFETAKELLNYGFSNYNAETFVEKNTSYNSVEVEKGKKTSIATVADNTFKKLVSKNRGNEITTNVTYSKEIKAPVKKGDIVGKIQIMENNKPIGEVNIVSAEDVKRLNIFDIYGVFLSKWFLK